MTDDTFPTEIALQSLDRVAFLDPASGKAKTRKVQARSAIVVLGQDPYHRIFVLHAWAAHVPVPSLVEKMFEINDTFKPRVFGGEADALQTLFQEAVRLIAHDRKVQLPLQPITHSTRIEKEFRIRTTLQPVIAEGRLILRADQQELLAELEGFPVYSTVDLVDALASAIDLLPHKALRKQKDEQAMALAAYLRKTGAPASYIEQRLSQQNVKVPFSAHPLARIMAQGGVLRRPLPKHLQNGGST